MSSSDSEDERCAVPSRLGPCEVCGANDAIYSCPKCEVKTCQLACITIHKKELDCDGIRDRTKFIRMKDFTDIDLLSDYRMLEECARFVYGKKRDERKRFTRIDKDLPVHLFKLKMAARKRGIALQFLMQNFTRHTNNTTRYDWKTNVISWRVEWVFPNAEPNPVKFTDERCSEETKLSVLLEKYLKPDGESFEGSKSLVYYQAAGFNGVKVLLKAEKVKGSAKKYFDLDPKETLAENLAGKCIVEFPIICVALKDHAYNFEIINSEDEFDTEFQDKERVSKEVNTSKPQYSDIPIQNSFTNKVNITQEGNTNSQTNGFHYRPKRPRQLLTQKFAQEKKLELEKEVRAERKKRPKNLLFTTGYSSEESLDDSDEDETKIT